MTGDLPRSSGLLKAARVVPSSLQDPLQGFPSPSSDRIGIPKPSLRPKIRRHPRVSGHKRLHVTEEPSFKFLNCNPGQDLKTPPWLGIRLRSKPSILGRIFQFGLEVLALLSVLINQCYNPPIFRQPRPIAAESSRQLRQ